MDTEILHRSELFCYMDDIFIGSRYDNFILFHAAVDNLLRVEVM